MVNSQHRAFLSAQLEAKSVPLPPDWVKQDAEDEALFERAKEWAAEGQRALKPARYLSRLSIACLVVALSLPLFFPVQQNRQITVEPTTPATLRGVEAPAQAPGPVSPATSDQTSP